MTACHRKTARWRVMLVTLLIGLAFGALPMCRIAVASSVSMSVNVGFQSYFDPRVWAPVRVTVMHSGSRALSGTLEYGVSGKSPYDGELIWPVKVPAGVGVSTSVSIGLPGHLLARGGVLKLVVQGQTEAQIRLIGVAVQGSDIAGVVSTQPQAVQFLAGVSSANGSSELVTAFIRPQQLPQSLQLLQSLSYLYLDGSVADQLSSAQVHAVLAWVRSGGILIFGGVEPNAGQLGAFSAFTPVSGAIVLDQSGAPLANFAGAQPPRGSLALLYGTARKDATVLIGDRTNALVADRALGRGEVVYAGFDAASSSLVSWTGNAMLWEGILHAVHGSVLTAKPDLFGQTGTLSLLGAAEQFPQLHAPPLWIWEVVFGVYTFICGPVLYVLLRRRRKNEWAWAVLPLMSILLAAGIYELGILQRPNGILTQSVGLIDIVDANLAQVVGVEALMSPQTRSYTVTTPPSTWSVALAEGATALGGDARVVFTGGGGLSAFSAVPAWGGRFVYAVHDARRFGSVQGALFTSIRSLAGYLVNDTNVNLTDAALIDQGQVVMLGPIKRGATVSVDALLRKKPPRSPLTSQIAAALSGASHGVGRALFDSVPGFVTALPPQGSVILIAWTHSEPPVFSPGGNVLPATPQWMIRQVIPVTPVLE